MGPRERSEVNTTCILWSLSGDEFDSRWVWPSSERDTPGSWVSLEAGLRVWFGSASWMTSSWPLCLCALLLGS